MTFFCPPPPSSLLGLGKSHKINGGSKHDCVVVIESTYGNELKTGDIDSGSRRFCAYTTGLTLHQALWGGSQALDLKACVQLRR